VRQVFEEHQVTAKRHYKSEFEARLSHLPKPESLASLYQLYPVSELADLFGEVESFFHDLFDKMDLPRPKRSYLERRMFDYAEAWRMHTVEKMTIEEVAVHFERPRVTIYRAFKKYYGWSDPRKNKNASETD